MEQRLISVKKNTGEYSNIATLKNQIRLLFTGKTDMAIQINFK